jgi:hypothetical protein
MSELKPPSLEDRVRELERSRVVLLGALNASNQLLLDLWNLTLRRSEDPASLALQLQSEWLAKSDAMTDFPGVDPAYLDGAAQEYREALERLTDRLVHGQKQ